MAQPIKFKIDFFSFFFIEIYAKNEDNIDLTVFQQNWKKKNRLNSGMFSILIASLRYYFQFTNFHKKGKKKRRIKKIWSHDLFVNGI